MSRAHLIGAALVLAMAGAGRAAGPCHRIVRQRRVRMEPDPAGHRPRPAQPAHAPLLRDDPHRDVRRDQRDRAGVRALSRPRALAGLRLARRPRPPRPPTTSWSPSTRRPRRSTTRRSPVSSATVRRSTPAGAPRSAPRSPRRSWRGARTTAGSSRRSRPTPSRRCPGAGSATPPANAAAAFTHLQNAAPMALVSADAVPAGRPADAARARATPPT